MQTMIDNRIVDALAIASQYPVIKKVGVFGSYARGEQTLNSDIDILYDYLYDDENTVYILDVLNFIEQTENIVKQKMQSDIKVDFVSLHGLLNSKNEKTRNNILNDVIWIYEQ